MPETRATLRRAGRTTIVASLGFYGFRYGLDDPVAATYALFGAVALGAFAQVTGAPAVRARTLLATLPAGWLLVVAGTLLSVSNWSAALGMLVLGFAVSYAGVGGPRVVSVVNGLQLMYILACFPPFAPGTLAQRLLGLGVGVALLALAELALWPDPVPESFEHRLGIALRRVAARIRAEAATLAPTAGPRSDGPRSDGVRSDGPRSDGVRSDGPRSDGVRSFGGRAGGVEPLDELAASLDALRPSRLPPELRPSSAGRRDHALAHASGTLRYTLARLADLVAADRGPEGHRPAAGVLLGRTAARADDAARWLTAGGPPPDGAALPRALDDFRATRAATPADGLHPDQLRLGSLALSVADGMAVLVTAVRVAAGAPVDVQSGQSQGSFWYATRRSPALWWSRLREHLTPRSVYFQGALRLAVALALARLLAGVLAVEHGFWVLLAILTVLRASAAATRAVLWPSLLGTVIGAAAAGVLLALVTSPTVYALILPGLMFVGFAAGPLLGQVAGQAVFTVVIATVFAQLEPPGWRLAEVRLLDVLLGGAIGVLIGLCAWPRGGAGELHRASGNFLADCAATIRTTVTTLTAPPTSPLTSPLTGEHSTDSWNPHRKDGSSPGARVPGVLVEARRDGQLADASFALYQSETRRRYVPTLDWQATLVAGHHVVRGAEGLLRYCPVGRLVDCLGPLGTTSASVAAGYDAVAAQLLTRRPVDVPPVAGDGRDWPAGLGADLYHLADLRVWLDGVGADLRRINPQ